MASLYKRPGSPFWWVKWRKRSGKVGRKSTGERHGDMVSTRRAKVQRDKLSLEESATPADRQSDWPKWVVDYLEARHSASPLTLSKQLSNWRTLTVYLDDIEIGAPQQLARQHALGYVAWRKRTGSLKGRGGAGIHHNTILDELKTLCKLMNEARRRGWVDRNPVEDLGLKKVAPKVKGEMTDAHIAKIRAEISRLAAQATVEEKIHNADFLSVSFEIALRQGLRLSETWFPLAAVDFTHGTIETRVKGGQIHRTPLNDNLVPLLRKLAAEGRTHTYARPRIPGLRWFKFFDRLRAKDPSFADISFHSTRVTFISRLERSGVPESVCSRIVNHGGGGSTVHRVYRRYATVEMTAAWNSLQVEDTRAAPALEDSAPAILSPSADPSSDRTKTPNPPASTP